MVVLGDSSNRPTECDGCDGYVNDYAQAIEQRAGVPVDIHNDSAIELSNVPTVDASALLAQILTDPAVRNDITDADIIVITVGFNDTPWNRLDDPCDAAPHYPVVRWSKITTEAMSFWSRLLEPESRLRAPVRYAGPTWTRNGR